MAALDRVRERLRDARDRVERTRGEGGGAGQGLDLERVGAGERLAAASAVALLLLMLLDWFRGMSAWQLKWVDLMLFGIAALVLALTLSEAIGTEQLRREAIGLALVVLGAVAVGAMLVLVLESTGGTVPLVASLLAAGGILYGGYLALRPSSPGSGGGFRRRAQPPREQAGPRQEPRGGAHPFDRGPSGR